MLMQSPSNEKLPLTEKYPSRAVTPPAPVMKPPSEEMPALPVISPEVEIVAPTSTSSRLYSPSSIPSQSQFHSMLTLGP